MPEVTQLTNGRTEIHTLDIILGVWGLDPLPLVSHVGRKLELMCSYVPESLFKAFTFDVLSNLKTTSHERYYSLYLRKRRLRFRAITKLTQGWTSSFSDSLVGYTVCTLESLKQLLKLGYDQAPPRPIK